MAPLDAQIEADLKAVYYTFASFGSSQRLVEMEGKNLQKLCKDAKLLCKALTTTDVDLIFAKVKAKGARKITWPEFLKALDQFAAKKGCALDDVIAVVVTCGGPQDNGTKAEAVRFHDDKSLYTGVYARGGPTNVDMDPKNLAGLCDWSSADVRGVKLTGPGAANRRTTGDAKIPAVGGPVGSSRRATAEAASVGAAAKAVQSMKI